MKITAELDYVQGHLRTGHLELEIDKHKWESIPEDNRRGYFLDTAEVVVDDFDVEDYGEAGEMVVKE